MAKLYYIEKDGRVYLEEKGGRLCLPDKAPFKIKNMSGMKMPGANVIKCEPVTEEYPEHWLHKDGITLMDNVDETAKKAVVQSFTRVAAGAFIVKDGKLLMTKANRGLTKGYWNIPGGFVDFGESFEEAVKREVKEEIGLEVKVKKLIGLYSDIEKYHMLVASYICEVVGGKLRPSPTEVEEVKWFPLKAAEKTTKNIFTKWTLRDMRRLK